MKIKHHNLDIPRDGSDPFVNCKLDRKQYAEVLTSIVTTYADGFVLAINNKWGTGKTTFVKMWEQDLKNTDFQTLYFNAWENDFQQEVIIALIAELSELREKGEKTFKSVVKKGAAFLTKVAPSVAKGVASKAVGEGAIADISEAITEFTTEQLEGEIEKFAESKKGIEEFREALQKFVEKVDNEKPVVFIIDELDRCRPNYAVSVLEEIKHLFSVPGIVFVLSIDKVQLGNAIRGVYGSDLIDADEYLRRFMDLEYKIPEPTYEKYINYLMDYYELNSFYSQPDRRSGELSYEIDNLNNVAKLLFNERSISLRQLNKTFGRIRLTLQSFSIRQFTFPEIVVFLAYLHLKHQAIYNKLEKSEYDFQGLIDAIDPILFKFKGTDKYRKALWVYGALLSRYKNQYYRIYHNSQLHLINRDVSDNLIKLIPESKLENENDDLARVIMNFDSKFHTSDIKLEYIQKRYSLLENLK